MIEGSGPRVGSGSIPLTSGSGWPKNMWIRWIRIRIRNTAFATGSLLRWRQQLIWRQGLDDGDMLANWGRVAAQFCSNFFRGNSQPKHMADGNFFAVRDFFCWRHRWFQRLFARKTNNKWIKTLCNLIISLWSYFPANRFFLPSLLATYWHTRRSIECRAKNLSMPNLILRSSSLDCFREFSWNGTVIQ